MDINFFKSSRNVRIAYDAHKYKRRVRGRASRFPGASKGRGKRKRVGIEKRKAAMGKYISDINLFVKGGKTRGKGTQRGKELIDLV